MKKLLITACAAALLWSCSAGEGFTINGNVAGLVDSVQLVDHLGERIASSLVEDGKFTFEGVADQPQVAMLSSAAMPFAMLVLENGEINIEGDINRIDNISVSGTVSNDRMQELAAVRKGIGERYAKAETDEEREALYDEEIAAMEGAVNGNLDNYFGLMMLFEAQSLWTSQQTLDKLAQFAPGLQTLPLANDIREAADKKARSEAGTTYLDIALPDAEGNIVKLSSVVGEGKWVLLDFWASWCVPCMNEMPYLKQAYERFHPEGFEVYAVSLDRTNDAWLGAIEKEQMNWIHVTSLGQQAAMPVFEHYNVQTIPANFLIDPSGKIVAKGLRQQALIDKLAELIDHRPTTEVLTPELGR